MITASRSQQSLELFAVLETFRSRVGALIGRLNAIASSPQSPRLLGADAYYRPNTDIALVALRFDVDSSTRGALQHFLAGAREAEIPVLDPCLLELEEQREFYGAYLGQYPIRFDQCDSAHMALMRLCAELRIDVSATSAAADSRPSGRYSVHRGRRASTRERAQKVTDAATPPPLPPQAPNTRESAPRGPHPRLLKRRRATATLLPPIARGKGRAESRNDEPTVKIARVEPERRGKNVASSTRPDLYHPSFDAPAQPPPIPGHAQTCEVFEAEDPTPTTKDTPAVPDAFASETSSAQQRTAVERHPSPTLRLPSPTLDSPPPPVSVRILRGDSWYPARLRTLSVRQAHIACGAPPRPRDHVDIEIQFQDLMARTRGQVTEVDRLRAGASGFRVMFSESDRIARRQLVALLLRARETGLSLEPPPARSAVRYPVRWPAQLTTAEGEIPAAALDISESGIFFAVDHDVQPTTDVTFTMPLDRDGPPLCGRARVVRAVDDSMAETRGLDRGYGVQIIDLTGNDRRRFREFLSRVGRRVERRVVVAAAADRTDELARSLISCGYAVTGRSDAQQLLQLVDSDPRPPDVAVIDARGGRSREARWLRTMFENRSVPCVSARSEAADQTREAVDRVLSVDR